MVNKQADFGMMRKLIQLVKQRIRKGRHNFSKVKKQPYLN